MTIALTVVMFVVGIISYFTQPGQRIEIRSIHWKVELLILLLPATLVVVLLVMIICIAVRENALRALLKSVSDMV